MTDWLTRALDHINRTQGQVVLDSRLVQPGDVFVALPGQAVDGREFITHVLGQSSVLVLAEREAADQPLADQPNVIWVDGLRKKIGQLAEALYAVNSMPIGLVGITGTNGKTSISHYLAQALHQAGGCGLIGTLGTGLWPTLKSSRNTTPDVLTNHALLARWGAAKAPWAVMEVSSHALDQGRVDGLRFRVAAFTHLSRDHLDYHPDMDSYFAAKQRLFDPARSHRAVICTDDRWGQKLVQYRRNALRVSGRIGGTASVAPSHIERRPEGLLVNWTTPWGPLCTDTQLLGDFNVANLAVTIGVLGSLGFTGVDIERLLGSVKPVLGRMQPMPLTSGATAIIDYAHTPDALEKALRAARHHTRGQLHCVFGCGGDRDRGKRPQMAAAAAALADHLWLTSDNNRSEPFPQIISDMLPGLPAGMAYDVVAGRADAIRLAVQAASDGDVILIAGKGHEDYQEEDGVRLPYSDQSAVEQAQEALS